MLAALGNAVTDAATADNYFDGMSTMLDAAGSKLTISLDEPFHLDASVSQSNPPSWILVPFPAQLCDAVVRGAVSDWLKFDGQQDKGEDEEKAVPIEAAAQTGPRGPQQFSTLSDQTAPRSRYAVR